jgi:hypothetical protein
MRNVREPGAGRNRRVTQTITVVSRIVYVTTIGSGARRRVGARPFMTRVFRVERVLLVAA